MRLGTLTFLLALSFVAAAFAAAPEDPPLGRSMDQRFGRTDPNLVFDTRQGAAGNGRTFQAGKATMKSFYTDASYTPPKYEARTFSGAKTSWWSKLNFFTKGANTRGKYEIPNADKPAAVETADTGKYASIKDAREASKTMAVRDLPDGNRSYLGPERKKLDQAVDPSKPISGWSGNKLQPLSLEEVRELLNKNK